MHVEMHRLDLVCFWHHHDIKRMHQDWKCSLILISNLDASFLCRDDAKNRPDLGGASPHAWHEGTSLKIEGKTFTLRKGKTLL